MDRGLWWATVHGVAESQTRLKRLSMSACCPTTCRSLHPSCFFSIIAHHNLIISHLDHCSSSHLVSADPSSLPYYPCSPQSSLPHNFNFVSYSLSLKMWSMSVHHLQNDVQTLECYSRVQGIPAHFSELEYSGPNPHGQYPHLFAWESFLMPWVSSSHKHEIHMWWRINGPGAALQGVTLSQFCSISGRVTLESVFSTGSECLRRLNCSCSQ